MSFSFYEQWVNTAHVNDILTQRSMNNASEFTFMPESDPSRHPSPPSPSLLHLFPSSILTIHPHQNSASFLPPPLLTPPSLPPSCFLPPPLPPTPPSNRKRHRVRLLFTSSRYRCLLSGSGQTPLKHLHNHEGGIGTLVSLFFSSTKVNVNING